MPLWLLLAASLAAAEPPPQPAFIGMGEYAVAKAPATHSLGTLGVATCIAVFLYDPAAKAGALGHFAATTDVAPSIRAMRRGLARAGAAPGRLRATLIGGWDTRKIQEQMGFRSTSPELLAEIKAALRGVPIAREETLTVPFSGKPGIRNVVLDLETGEVSDYLPSGPVTPSDAGASDASVKTPLRLRALTSSR